MRQHDVIRGNAARAAAFQQRRMEPAAMLIRAFEIHDAILSAFDNTPARDALEPREGFRVVKRESVCAAGIEPHVEHIFDLLPLG